MIWNCNIDCVCTHVKFVSYTGRYPNLCSGVLTLLIDGKEVKFGHETEVFSISEGVYKDSYYDRFWHPANGAEWYIDFEEIPEKYQKYALEIDAVFNDNVEQGCCGGCL